MFGGLVDLFVLLALGAFLLVAWKFWQQRADEKLRDNPPQRRIIEVSLPVGVSDSVANMSRFYRKVAAAALGDSGARKSGMRQIDFVYLVDVPAEGALPRMRCRIYADPDKMDAVKKALKSSFQEAIDVVELPEDDLLPIAQILRPPEEEEEEEMEIPRALLEESSEDSEDDSKDKSADEEPADRVSVTDDADEEDVSAVQGEETNKTPLSEQLDQIVPEMPPVPQRPPSRDQSSIDFVIEEDEGGPPRFE